MYSCKCAGGRRARWGLGSDGTGIGIRPVSEWEVSSWCSAWCGVEAKGSGLGGRNRSGGVEPGALDTAGTAQQSPRIRQRQV